ncbi:hypothetical protein O3G_MSEX015520 [Manduca sexta]|uniref:Zinc finger Sec23/Sec24-type domain-containing protein n=1 Tax=Manduca sexta TaxID=7130 RepID=A0A922A131_MANSE|nr:hypothetical protein O3G_MSEX015520 [Manduca sexta]
MQTLFKNHNKLSITNKKKLKDEAYHLYCVVYMIVSKHYNRIIISQISPMAETVGAEQEPPLLDFAALTGSPAMGPVRCCRCKAYMCPYMKFIDAGRHFKCAFCKATTEVPMEYTQYVTSMQQYGRVPAEMALGTYEIVATKEYCRVCCHLLY